MYPIVETFYSLQGEGAYSGAAAFFIRIAGCPVHCSFCDEKRSWDLAAHSPKTAQQITEAAIAANAKIAVVTGGEPTQYDLAPLTDTLHRHNICTHLETAGIKPLTGTWDHITFSPKPQKLPLEEYYTAANEIKIIIETGSDFDFAEQQYARTQPQAKFYLQPEWNNRAAVMPAIIEYIKQNPQWRLSLQTHKYIDIQ
jgi:organic radical activating enzyme